MEQQRSDAMEQYEFAIPSNHYDLSATKRADVPEDYSSDDSKLLPTLDLAGYNTTTRAT
jgi:hypothetical protein